MAEGSDEQQFFVTRESQETIKDPRKASYAGLRDLSDLEKIKELDIVGPDGTIRGIKNRVRAGLATFENRGALVKKNTEEGKIIAYTTSFHGVRQTYEECKYVLTIFHNLRVRVEERDIYVNKFYYRELEERLGLKSELPVPQVYISGQHVGGAAELEVLNETGELRKLLADIPRQESSTACPMCGGYGFIPCRKCGGSKNSVANEFTAEFRALKCTHCTENGLEPCPECEKRRANVKEDKEMKAVRKEKELREKEKADHEKREKIKREALEAERLSQLEREEKEKEKQRKKERARREKERKKRAAEVRKRVAEEIARELEREKQWRAEQETKPSDELSETVEIVNDSTVLDVRTGDSETEHNHEEGSLQEATQEHESDKETEVSEKGHEDKCVDETSDIHSAEIVQEDEPECETQKDITQK